MKKNIIVIILLVLCIVGIFAFCKFKSNKKDFVEQPLPTPIEEQVQNENNTDEIKLEPDDEKEKENLNLKETKNTSKTQVKKEIQTPPKYKNQIKSDKNIVKDEKNIEDNPLLKETHRSTRSDVVNVQTEYISPKNSGQIYYQGVFYNVKIRQELDATSQNQDKPEVKTIISETKTVIESKPIEPVLKPVKFEKTLNNPQQNTSEAIKNTDEVILKP